MTPEPPASVDRGGATIDAEIVAPETVGPEVVVPETGVSNAENRPSAGVEEQPVRRSSWKRWAITAFAVSVVAVAAEAERKLLSRSIGGLDHLRWGWVAAAVVFESASMASFARMHRRVLRSGGLRLTVGSVLAVTYAGNAISSSLPVAGSGAAAGFTYRQFSARGAGGPTSAWVLAVAGIISSTAFALILSAGAIQSGNPAAIVAGATGAALTIIPLGALLIALHRPRARDWLIRFVVGILRQVQRRVGRPAGDPDETVRGAIANLGELRLSRRDAAIASIFSINNWLFDIACLVCAIEAVGQPVPSKGLILAWAAGTGAASFKLTPGGVGVVEAALAPALVAIGVRSTPAVTSTLVYRFISFWLMLVVGWVAYWAIHRRAALTASPSQPSP
jgi:uncharacterized protein (TIRG00374 family)